jgi:hypothetical protein
VVASKYSQNHFISEKYKTVQLFKLQFLQNNPLVQLDTSASDSKGVENIPGSHFVSLFSIPVAFLMMSVAPQNRSPFSANFSRENR